MKKSLNDLYKLNYDKNESVFVCMQAHKIKLVFSSLFHVGLDIVENLVSSEWNLSAWTEHTFAADLVEHVVVLWWDDTASDHNYVPKEIKFVEMLIWLSLKTND